MCAYANGKLENMAIDNGYHIGRSLLRFGRVSIEPAGRGDACRGGGVCAG